MNKSILIAICLLGPMICDGQVSYDLLSMQPGKYRVGFQHYMTFDSTRTYIRTYDWNNHFIPRPISICVWYPALRESESTNPMSILDYMEILKVEEEWENLPDQQILNWFSYENTPENRDHLKEKTNAFRNVSPESQQFPVIVYAPSYQASSIENFGLFEYLASYGYVIVSSSSRGTESRLLEGGKVKDIETQARDIDFLIQELNGKTFADPGNIATMGFSFGGLSNVLAQMKNGRIKAIISLDGSIKYQYETIRKAAFFSIEKVNVPFIHFAQKDIPESVMVQDNIDPKLNFEFQFFDDLINSTAYSFKFHHLSHSYFSTLGILFEKRDQRQDRSDLEIIESNKIMSLYTLRFLDAFLKDHTSSRKFIDSEPDENGISPELVSMKSKLPKEQNFTFEEFNMLASGRLYNDLKELYDSIQVVHSSFKLEEWKLNNLGLQLIFNPKASTSFGINVFLLATEIYPDSSNLFDSLGEGYLFTGDKKLAAESFRKSLRLNPQNQNAAVRLKELGNSEQ